MLKSEAVGGDANLKEPHQPTDHPRDQRIKGSTDKNVNPDSDSEA